MALGSAAALGTVRGACEGGWRYMRDEETAGWRVAPPAFFRRRVRQDNCFRASPGASGGTTWARFRQRMRRDSSSRASVSEGSAWAARLAYS
jgi:hypothetical protein